MRKSNKEYLRRLAEEANDTVSLLSDSRKPEKERRVCAAFLRCMGVSFAPNDLVSVPKAEEPPDVRFRDAAFEVKVEYGNQKVHEKWKSRARRRQKAKTMSHVLESPQKPDAWSAAQMLECVIDVLKQQRYSPETRSRLDVLVYINDPGAYLAAGSKVCETTALKPLGWRSISVLFPPYACVLFASTFAPSFLSKLSENIKIDSHDPDQWFKL